MVVKHLKFVVWPLNLSVPTAVGHSLYCDYESIPQLSENVRTNEGDETTWLLCRDHEMQPLCCFINENQPLNEGASTAVTHLEVDTARQSGRRIGPQGVMFEDRDTQLLSELENMLDGRSRYYFARIGKGKVRKRAREPSRIPLRKLQRLLQKSKRVDVGYVVTSVNLFQSHLLLASVVKSTKYVPITLLQGI